MKLFSLSWFKSQKNEQLEDLQIEEQKLKNQLLQKDLELWDKDPFVPSTKPYVKVKLVGTVLTVVLNDGSVLSKQDSDISEFTRCRQLPSEDDIIRFFNPPVSSKISIEEPEKVREINESQAGKNIEILSKSEQFEILDRSVYMKGINRSMPAMLVNRFADLYKKYNGLDVEKTDEFQSLTKFWLKCCLNPNAQSAEDLYGFLENHQFKIDKHGNFYAYRRVVSKNTQNKELVEFISNAYNKVKAVWKKRPSDYRVIEKDGNYSITNSVVIYSQDEIENIGNLEELYMNLPNIQEEAYTSAHTGLEDYRVGEVISMPRNEGDDDNSISCSKGFHAASKKYDYSGFGDTPILMIVNPMDVLSVPVGEVGKLRTCRWFFAMTLPENEKYILDDPDFDVTELGDIFEQKCEINEEYVKNSFAEEIKRHTFNVPSISADSISTVIDRLNEMKAVISNRVQHAGW